MIRSMSADRLLSAALRSVGKTYSPDPQLPLGLVAHVLSVRAIWLGRGLLRFRRMAFIGPRVQVRGKRRIMLGRASSLERGVTIDGYARHGVSIGARTRIGPYTTVSCTSHLSLLGEGLTIGHDSGISEFGFIGAAGGVRIGSNVIMGQYVSMHSQEHRFHERSTPIRDQGSTEQGILIDDDCWIGARVTFLDGSHVRAGSIVAAGAVVKGEFPANAVIAGVPARLVRQRFSDSQ